VKRVTFAKNGPGVVFHVWEVDNERPTVWRDGDRYHFNSELIGVYNFTHRDLAGLLQGVK